MHSVSSIPIELKASAKYGHLVIESEEPNQMDQGGDSMQVKCLDFGVLQSIKGLKKHLHIRNDGCVLYHSLSDYMTQFD